MSVLKSYRKWMADGLSIYTTLLRNLFLLVNYGVADCGPATHVGGEFLVEQWLRRDKNQEDNLGTAAWWTGNIDRSGGMDCGSFEDVSECYCTWERWQSLSECESVCWNAYCETFRMSSSDFFFATKHLNIIKCHSYNKWERKIPTWEKLHSILHHNREYTRRR